MYVLHFGEHWVTFQMHELNSCHEKRTPWVVPSSWRVSCCCCLRAGSRLTLRPRGLQPTRLLCPWAFPGKNTGVGCHFLLQGIFPTQGSNPGLLHCRQILYQLSQQGSPWMSRVYIKTGRKPGGTEKCKFSMDWKRCFFLASSLRLGRFWNFPRLMFYLSSLPCAILF